MAGKLFVGGTDTMAYYQNNEIFYVTSELFHFAGIGILEYKLKCPRSAEGISLRAHVV